MDINNTIWYVVHNWRRFKRNWLSIPNGHSQKVSTYSNTKISYLFLSYLLFLYPILSSWHTFFTLSPFFWRFSTWSVICRWLKSLFHLSSWLFAPPIIFFGRLYKINKDYLTSLHPELSNKHKSLIITEAFLLFLISKKLLLLAGIHSPCLLYSNITAIVVARKHSFVPLSLPIHPI